MYDKKDPGTHSLLWIKAWIESHEELKDSDWKFYEVETLALQLTDDPTPLILDKISVLRIILRHPDLFFSNIMVFLHATEVMNNIKADFDFLPTPTSLEMAYSIVEMAKLLQVSLHELPKFESEVISGIKHLLINEGYSHIIPPFDIVGITGLTEGQTEEDTLDKKKAIEQYVTSMSN